MLYRRNSRNNTGRKKYNAGKGKLENTLNTYVNAEINRMLETKEFGMISKLLLVYIYQLQC